MHRPSTCLLSTGRSWRHLRNDCDRTGEAADILQRSAAFRRIQIITKDKWLAVMRAAGFTEEDMHRWHREFEKAAPDEHQEFLEFLHVPADEIARIREWSRT